MITIWGVQRPAAGEHAERNLNFEAGTRIIMNSMTFGKDMAHGALFRVGLLNYNVSI